MHNTRSEALVAQVPRAEISIKQCRQTTLVTYQQLPNFWPRDRRRIPEAIAFCVTKGVNAKMFESKSNQDLSLDHSQVIIALHSQILEISRQPTQHSKHPD